MTALVLPFVLMDQRPNRIFELRTRAKLSQEELGHRAGMSKMNVSGLERGERALTIDAMRRLASALGVYAADLLSRADNPMAPQGEELDLIETYRAAPPERRQDIARVAETLVAFRHRDAA